MARIAKYLEWKEFVVAFFVVAFAAAVPDFFVGITAIAHGIPELAFANVIGGNLVDLTVAVALAAFFARGLPAESRMVQTSALFTMVIAILPLLLILDGTLGRGDGVILIVVFAFYIYWLFSKKERFAKIYNIAERPIIKSFREFMKDIGKMVAGAALLLVATEGIVRSASFFADALSWSLPLVGILIVGVGSALPELYFAVSAAQKKAKTG